MSVIKCSECCPCVCYIGSSLLYVKVVIRVLKYIGLVTINMNIDRQCCSSVYLLLVMAIQLCNTESFLLKLDGAFGIFTNFHVN